MDKLYNFASLEFGEYVSRRIEESKKEILTFFEVENSPNYAFDIYIYKTKKTLREELEKRGFKNNPKYMCACFKKEDYSLNFFEPKDNPKSLIEWSKQEYIDENIVFHETVLGLIYYIYPNCKKWISEGLAKLLDGYYDEDIYTMINDINHHVLSSSEELSINFGKKDEYDYLASYIMVSYLIQKEGKSNFLTKLKDDNYIKTIENKTLIKEAIDYYSKVKVRRKK